LKAAGSAERSARDCAGAFDCACSFACARFDTHLPKAFALLPFVP
jgi:hypothetical protein